MVQAQTFTFKYDPREDRMILTLNYASNTARVDFMITRAMVLKLLPVIEQILMMKSAPQPQAAAKKERSTRGKEEATDRDMLELMGKNRYLLEKIDFKTFKENSNIAMLFFAENTLQAQAVLTHENFSQIMNIMVQSLPHHGWGIAPNILAW